MALTRRGKLLLVAGLLVSIVLLMVAYTMMNSSAPASGVKPAPVSGWDIPAANVPANTQYIPPTPPYIPSGDSTPDGTPVDGTQPTVPPPTPAPAPAPAPTPVVSTPAPMPAPVVEAPPPVVETPPPEPPFSVVCSAQRDAIISHYKTKTGTPLSISLISINPIDSTTCDAGMYLMDAGTTNIRAADSRRFVFSKSGISMGAAGSGTSITVPTVVPAPTTVIEAPPIDLITDYSKYFTKFADKAWNTISGVGSTADLDACQKACYAGASCVGFNYNPSTRYCFQITNKGDPVLSAVPGRDYYQRLPTKTVVPTFTPQIAPGDTTNYLSNFAKTASRYFSTGDKISFNTNTAADCAVGCQRDATCSAFNFWPSLYKCEQVRGYTDQGLSYHSAADFYRKIVPTPVIAAPVLEVRKTRAPVYDGNYLDRFRKTTNNRLVDTVYSYISSAPNTYVDGVDVNINNVADCAKSCYDNTKCKAFNFDRDIMRCRQILMDTHKYTVNSGSSYNDSYELYDAYLYTL